MSSSAGRRRNARGEGAQLRAELVSAARDLLAESGAGAVTLRAVARRVGVAPNSIYAHFGSPEEIVRAVVAGTFDELVHHLEAGRAGVDDPRARLLAGCRAYLDFGVQQPALYALLFARDPGAGPAGTPTVDSRVHEEGEGVDKLVGAEPFTILVDDVAAAAAAGVSRTDDSFLTATALWVALHGLVILRADAPQFPWPDTEQLDTALCERVALLEPARRAGAVGTAETSASRRAARPVLP